MSEQNNTHAEVSTLSIETSGSETLSVDVENVSLELDSNVEARQTLDGDKEFEFSCEIEMETEEVVCPNCTCTNTLPNGLLLNHLTTEPAPCVLCGYPLL